MRITSGHLKGRTLRVPSAGVRPSQDRLRQSLFSSLGGRLDGWRVLDLFAGSGALGLEAWSRGAEEVVWIEHEPRVFSVLHENVRTLCGAHIDSRARCIRGDALQLARWGRTLATFDLVLADPPYDVVLDEDVLQKLLEGLPAAGLIRPNGYFACEMRAGETPPIAPGWELRRTRKVGGSQWALYRRLSEIESEMRDPKRHDD